MLKHSNEDLIKLIKAGIDTKENYLKLYNQNKGFIYQIIHNRVFGINEVDDLMQQAYLALMKAVELFDKSKKEISFLTLLKYCIFNEIRNLQIDLPSHMRTKIVKYKRIFTELYNKLGYKPNTIQIMLEMNISLNELNIIKVAMRYPVSLDEPIGDGEDATRMDLISDYNTNLDEDLEKKDLKNIVCEAVQELSDKTRQIIDKRYYQNNTFTNIAKDMNISIERSRQINQQGLTTLRKNKRFEKRVIDYISLNDYKSVGVNQFNRTSISSVEWLAIKREQLREMARVN